MARLLPRSWSDLRHAEKCRYFLVVKPFQPCPVTDFVAIRASYGALFGGR